VPALVVLVVAVQHQADVGQLVASAHSVVLLVAELAEPAAKAAAVAFQLVAVGQNRIAAFRLIFQQRNASECCQQRKRHRYSEFHSLQADHSL
jgi:hypothetical protein